MLSENVIRVRGPREIRQPDLGIGSRGSRIASTGDSNVDFWFNNKDEPSQATARLQSCPKSNKEQAKVLAAEPFRTWPPKSAKFIHFAPDKIHFAPDTVSVLELSLAM